MVAVFTPPGHQADRLPAPEAFGRDRREHVLPDPAGRPDANFRVRRRIGESDRRCSFPNLEEYRTHYWPDGGGYEQDSTSGTPGSSRSTPPPAAHRGDDLRLGSARESSQGQRGGDAAELHDMYVAATGTEPADRGCYPSTGARLRVGVDGRLVFPWIHRPRISGRRRTPDGDAARRRRRRLATAT